MENNEILEGNVLIAKFMGEKITFQSKSSASIQTHPNITESVENWAKYNSSWDWLMPVVEKIEAIGGDEHEFDIFGNCVQLGDYEEYVGKTKIEAVWKTVVEFIKSLEK